MKLALRYVICSQAVLAVSIIVCTALAPHFLFSSNEGGISNYAVHFATSVPVTIGFVACASLLAATAHQLDSYGHGAKFAPWLRVDATGYMLVLLSTYPYKLSTLFNKIHDYTALAFALLLLITAVWFVSQNHLDRLGVLAIVIILTGFGLGIATLTGVTHLLFLSQLVIGFGFGIALVHAIKVLTLHP
jgi:hypothetical protein